MISASGLKGLVMDPPVKYRMGRDEHSGIIPVILIPGVLMRYSEQCPKEWRIIQHCPDHIPDSGATTVEGIIDEMRGIYKDRGPEACSP